MSNPDEVMCGACRKPFIPRDGEIDIFRERFDDPGITVCKDCINRLTSHGALRRSDFKVQCMCKTMGSECPVHGGLVLPVRMN